MLPYVSRNYMCIERWISREFKYPNFVTGLMFNSWLKSQSQTHFCIIFLLKKKSFCTLIKVNISCKFDVPCACSGYFIAWLSMFCIDCGGSTAPRSCTPNYLCPIPHCPGNRSVGRELKIGSSSTNEYEREVLFWNPLYNFFICFFSSAYNLLDHFRYPAFFESRLGDGLQLSFNFIRSMSENSEIQQKVAENLKGKYDALFVNTRIGVSRIYKLIRGNRVSRNKFMSSVIRKFDNPCWSESVVPFLM